MAETSPYYFRTPSLCTNCFDSLSEIQKKEISRAHPHPPSYEREPPFSESFQSDWADMQRMGRIRFVLVRGVLGWGLSSAIIWSGLMSVGGGGTFAEYLKRVILTFPVAGVIWGILMWAIYERRMKREAVNSQNASQSGAP
jgi:hypothetical protein